MGQKVFLNNAKKHHTLERDKDESEVEPPDPKTNRNISRKLELECTAGNQIFLPTVKVQCSHPSRSCHVLLLGM